MWQRIDARTGEHVGEPGLLPDFLSRDGGITSPLTADLLADISWIGDPLHEEWKGVGFVEVPDPPVPEPVPSSVTNFQARAVLMQMPGQGNATLFESIDAALRAEKDDSPEGALAWQAWEQANDFVRAGVLVNTMSSRFGLTQGQLNDLFRAASKIEA